MVAAGAEAEGGDAAAAGSRSRGPRDLANVGLGEDETQGRDTLTYERPAMDVFKAIFASDDEDSDDDIRADIEEACGSELLDEDADEVVDVVLLWWRDDDGDLVDRLMDAITPLADDGVIWVVTPKTGKPGHVQPAEIAESAPTAGLMQTSSANLGDWIASRLVQPRSKAAGRH